jgi:hypothetical protein
VLPSATQSTKSAEVPTGLPGKLPYVNDMESPDALNGWDFDPSVWRLVADSGNVALVGNGGVKAPAVMRARNSPEWMDAASQSLLLTLRINLDSSSSGARVVLRYAENTGYYVVEMLAGTIAAKRGQAGKGLDRGSERTLGQRGQQPIRPGGWYELRIWVDASRIFVYLDNTLLISAEDTAQALPGGAILLSTLNTSARVRFDNIKVQRPLAASQHFQGSDWPTTWTRTDISTAKINYDTRGNGFIEVTTGDAGPAINPPAVDILMACRIQSIQGGLEVRMRESSAGAFFFQFLAGNMTLHQLDSTGKTVQRWSFPNFYDRSVFTDLIVEIINDQIRMFYDNKIFVQTIKDMPPPGNIRFTSPKPNDEFRIDDCLFAETAKSSTEDASWAFNKIREVEARPYQSLLTEWYDRFDDKFRTQAWYEGSAAAPGEFKIDQNDSTHRSFLRITAPETPTYRMFRNIREIYAFGFGQDKSTYFDSSDIYMRIDVRVSKGGTAWIAARTSPSLGGGTLNGYHLSVSRDESDTYTVKAFGYSTADQPIYFEGTLPAVADGTRSEWATLLIITYQDKVAFLANGRYLASTPGTSILNGTIAFGADKNTIADFDELQLRDVSPETR